jgi:hypothetical protein
MLIWYEYNGNRYFDISTIKVREAAYKHIMDELGNNGHYENSEPDEGELELFNGAINGNPVAIREFLLLRSQKGYRNESIEEVVLEQITEEK